jgi:NTE family protein
MTRAIVLGGGGVTGIAWEIGVLSGLADGGVDLRADAVIGTSAGAFVGAALASGTELEALFAAQRRPAAEEQVVRMPVVDPEQRRRTVESRLTTTEWPAPLRVTAINAVSGRLRVFAQSDGVPPRRRLRRRDRDRTDVGWPARFALGSARGRVAQRTGIRPSDRPRLGE